MYVGDGSGPSPRAAIPLTVCALLTITLTSFYADLAPLTTVGNLVSLNCDSCHTRVRHPIDNGIMQPFRRLCVTLGADITCGESTRLPYFHFVRVRADNVRSGPSELFPLRVKRGMVIGPTTPV